MAGRKERNRVLTVGFSSSEVERLSGVCTDAEFLEADSAKHVTDVIKSTAQSDVDLLIVSTRDRAQNEAVTECAHLREHEALDGVPMLAAISRYQMDIAHEVGRLRKVDFIIQPIEGHELKKKMRALGLAPTPG